jgi:hypothetical protein
MYHSNFLKESIARPKLVLKEEKREWKAASIISFDFLSSVCIDGTDPYSNIAFILTIIFVAIANILLLNVLIALFK